METTRRNVVPRRSLSEDPLDLVLSSIQGYALTLDADGKIVRVYAANAALLPGPRQSVVGRMLVDVFPAGVQKEILRCLQSIREGSVHATLEVECPTEDSGDRLFDLRFRRYRKGVFLLARDISATQRMARLVFEAVMDERRRISADLHDTVSSHLFGISLMANALAQDASEDVPVSAHDLSEIASLLSEGIDLVRTISHGLVLKEPTAVDLEDSLQKVAGTLRRSRRIDCTYKRVGELPSIHGIVAHHLEQIAHEAVRNAVKHGRASTITITLEIDTSDVNLEIRDDGLGITPSNFNDEGIGLQQMRHRANLIGANFVVESVPIQGTLVQTKLPLQKARFPRELSE